MPPRDFPAGRDTGLSARSMPGKERVAGPTRASRMDRQSGTRPGNQYAHETAPPRGLQESIQAKGLGLEAKYRQHCRRKRLQPLASGRTPCLRHQNPIPSERWNRSPLSVALRKGLERLGNMRRIKCPSRPGVPSMLGCSRPSPDYVALEQARRDRADRSGFRLVGCRCLQRGRPRRPHRGLLPRTLRSGKPGSRPAPEVPGRIFTRDRLRPGT